MPGFVRGLFGVSGGVALMLLAACSQMGEHQVQSAVGGGKMLAAKSPDQVVLNERQLMVANESLTFEELKQRVPERLSAEEGARVLVQVAADRIVKDDPTYSLQSRGGARGSAHGGGGRGYGGGGHGRGWGGRGWGGRGFYGGYGAWASPFFYGGLYNNYWYYPYNNYWLPYTWNAGAYYPYWGAGLNYSPFFYNYAGGLYPFTYNWGVPAYTTPVVQPVVQQPVVQTVTQPVIQQPVVQQPLVQQPVLATGTSVGTPQNANGSATVSAPVIAPGTSNTTLGGIWSR